MGWPMDSYRRCWPNALRYHGASSRRGVHGCRTLLTVVFKGNRSCGKGPVLFVNTSSSTSHDVASWRCLVQLLSRCCDRQVGSP
jgi:hypothetical protein